MKFNRDPMPDVSDDQLESQIVWVIGAPRTGSTWLADRLLRHDLIRLWDEPLIGRLFAMMLGSGEREHERNIDTRESRPQFVFSNQAESIWKESVRRFVLTQVRLRYPGLKHAPCRLVVKEPNGSEGADIVVPALPGSRLCFLARDPRDIMDSLLDLHNREWKLRPPFESKAMRLEWVEIYSREISCRLEATLKAFRGHPADRKILVTYESLRHDTFNELQKIYQFMGVPADKHHIEHRVKRFAYENLPDRFKGQGKQARFAAVGRWRQTLTEDDLHVLTPILAKWIGRFGYHSPEMEAGS